MVYRVSIGKDRKPGFMAGTDREVKAMNTQEIYETARELLDGAVYDMEQITADDAVFIADILASQNFVLRVRPEFSLVYAVLETHTLDRR